MSTATVSLRGITKRYGNRPAVTDVDLVLLPGERIALVGHNGAGKSTLIKLMLGLIRTSTGQIDVLGADITRHKASAIRADIGYLPENVVFPPAMTGRELLSFYARLKRRDVAQNQSLLERVGLVDAADQRTSTYSKGMRQRLGLAQALIGRPRLLLLDEPTTGLDPALRRTFYDIIDACAQDGATVLLSSHALAELESRSDRIVVMNRGLKVADGTLADLRALARCPTRIRADFGTDSTLPAESLGNRAGWRAVGVNIYEIACAEPDKMALVRRLMTLPAQPRDIEIVPPTLDDIYAHFLDRKAAE
ncbi:Cu-processing system ATP-binding protein [Enhydrobacter aerosaccus]|uniref:Cu-processing system ATP-binding protein n=1 Tax=Enhydrobacter aerosaccus TaxID=225324 RepID=A0A1T4SV03_9HYPH|nr:ABC transporter ATP-binding protein [Enhydrobacter aerosaccus]SKA32009.1 Cu-processing system ATP-binding protein [Enhydrobacter aerosaccus]